MTELPDPISRRERQRQTREALVFAARAVFAEVGYHRASLDEIARHAGFSKGAVYSNFDGKADLFLAVMDANMESALAEGGWDVFDREAPEKSQPPEIVDVMMGFALATLEFVAAAARDEQLAPELAARMEVLVGTYEKVAGRSRPPADPLSDRELGTLLAALDQGAALLTLAGNVTIDQQLLGVGMRRILDPDRAGAEATGEAGAEATGQEPAARDPALHHRVVQRRIAEALGASRLLRDEQQGPPDPAPPG